MAKSIRIRANVKDGTTTVKALVKHPMETGLRKSKETKKKIPKHFIQELTCAHNGATVVTAQWGPAISKDPYISFEFTGGKKGDTVTLSWVDNKGGKDSASAKVK